MKQILNKRTLSRHHELKNNSNKFCKVLENNKQDFNVHLTKSIRNNDKSNPKYFNSLENQREFMYKLFIKFELKTLDDFMKNKRKLRDNGGLKLLKEYNGNISTLLQSIYPYFPFDITSLLINKISNLKKIENQRKAMDKLFIKLKLISVEDWVNIKITKFEENGGKSLLLKYDRNFMKLLTTIYPHFPWQFPQKIIEKSAGYFKSIENQRNFMEKLSIKFNLQSLDDWINISRKKLIQNGGYTLIVSEYKKDKIKLLSSLYPNFPWAISSSLEIQSISNQRKRMNEIFKKLKLKSHEDWFNISKRKIMKNGGGLLYNYYNGDLFKLLTSVYPNLNFSPIKTKINSKEYFKSIENQKEFMDKLFIKLNLKSIDDWICIQRKIIIQNGGRPLLKYYKDDFSLLLQSIYPHYPLDFKLLKFKSIYFKSIEKQKEFMDYLFIQFNLNSVDDWLNINQTKINNSGGGSLLSHYKKDKIKLLSSVYPNYPWDNISLQQNSFSTNIRTWIQKFQITQKKDWYRLPVDIGVKYDLFDTLSLFYPSEKWRKEEFSNTRGKKTTQRLLFSFTQKIYPSLLIFEDYFHPKLMYKTINYELDIFIPALQLALEYQGEQHYDDMPAAGFGAAGLEFVQSRDKMKERLANDLSIKIIYIPYWWDQTFSSLQSSIHE